MISPSIHVSKELLMSYDNLFNDAKGKGGFFFIDHLVDHAIGTEMHQI